ncbi:MAG: MarR family transcriptional regulator [Candidatus Gracilibacteria bacterium]|jgi:DNA-binding MarR family transcriptional regulator|nr:MarR family transcriptional regulator [Candidatus Gracilibacteria bacterium]
MINEKKLKSLINAMESVVRKYAAIERHSGKFDTNLILHSSEIHLIDYIGQNSNAKPSDVARGFDITRGAVSQAISKLEQKSLLRKIPHPENRKEVMLSLTEKGKKAYRKHKKIHEDLNEGLTRELANIEPEQIEYVEKVLRKIELHIDLFDNGNN